MGTTGYKTGIEYRGSSHWGCADAQIALQRGA
jgi:hypothetical protein